MGRFSSFGSIILLAIALPLCAKQSATVPASTSQTETAPLRIPPPSENASAQELEKKGDELRAEKAFLDSVDYYYAAMKKDDTAALHNKAGISYFLLQRERDAKKEYQHAIKLDKSYPEAHNNLGALYYELHKYGAAIKEYKKAIKLNDLSASFHKNLGTAYFSQKDFDNASREYQRAMELDPSVFERQTSGGISINLISSNDIGHFYYVMAQMYGEHSNAERCRYYLAKANEHGYPIRDALHDGIFAGLRKDPAFVEFVRSLKPPSADSN
ncbi:MAG TPA: tetratricopeptide repeat protein [Candidatus Angelobacter sp.]|jgi:tetratricopeptide (TPR) repeat protein|nr:tetratricopeptide repeat protein [Candidatus Angelobacter sp.]